jgi:uncharacterized protein YicC (UPF0701 family)
VSREEWNDVITQEYNITMHGLDKNQRKLEMQRIQEKFGVEITRDDFKEPVTRVKAYVKQLERLVS